MKKLLVFLTMVALMMGMVAAGTNDTIVKAADRIVNLQSVSHGGWDWLVTSQTSFVGDSSQNCGTNGCSNIVGVTGLGLLDVYELTGSATYLTSAEKAGDYLVTRFFGSGDTVITSSRVNGWDLVLLYDLGKVSSKQNYTHFADKLLYNVLHETSYFSDGANEYGNACSNDGCSADEFFKGISYRRRNAGGLGIIYWDLFRWVEAAKKGGENTWASELSSMIGSNYTASFQSNDIFYSLGLSAVVLTTGNSDAVTKLLANQTNDGSFGEGIQDTAYAVMALKSVDQIGAVSKASSYLLSSFGYGGINGWKESDDEEYSEVDSEAVQALYDTIGSSQGAEGNLADYFWSISVTPALLSFGTIPRGSDITDPADNGPVTVYTTGSDTESNNVWVSVDVVETENFYTGLLELEDSTWKKAHGAVLMIPENNNEQYGARLHGSTLGLEPGAKQATIVYTAYGEPLIP